MPLSGVVPLVHFLPAYVLRNDTYAGGGLLQNPDRHAVSVAYPGTRKVTRAPQTHLCSMAHFDPDAAHDLLEFHGALTVFEIALTVEEAAVMGERVRLGTRVRTWLANMTSLGLYTYESAVILVVALPSAIVEAIQTGILRTSQEKVDGGTGNTPVQTRLSALYESGIDYWAILIPPGGKFGTRAAHKSAMHFVASAIAEGRAVIVDTAGSHDAHIKSIKEWGPEWCQKLHAAETQEELEATETTAATGMVIPNRVSQAPERALRPSVKVEPKSEQVKQEELERGLCKPEHLDNPDYVPERTSVENIGPPIIPCNAPLEPWAKENEAKGVQRHLAEGARPPSTDKARERFAKAVTIAMECIATEFSREELFKEMKLPEAWSSTLKEKTLEAASSMDRPYNVAGFVNLAKLGWPWRRGLASSGILAPLRLPRKQSSCRYSSNTFAPRFRTSSPRGRPWKKPTSASRRCSTRT